MEDLEVPSVGGDLLMRIRSLMPRLPQSSLKVARQVLDDSAAVTTNSIAELAALCETSQASVTRFCQALGLSGYPELKLRLAAESGRSAKLSWGLDMAADIEPGDSLERLASILALSNIRAIKQTLEMLEPSVLNAVSVRLSTARRINVFGAGGSSRVAQELQFRLSRLDLAVWAPLEFHSALESVALLGPDDVFIVISRSGRTIEAIEAMAEAQSRGATVVALTGFPNSPIGAKADLVLLTHVEETTARHGSVAARYGQFFLADCLYTAVAQRTFPQSAEALTVTTKALARHRSARRTNRPTTPNPQAPPITGTDIVTK